MNFNETPFGIPIIIPKGPLETLFQNANQVFSASFKFQKECKVSNCASFVNVILRRCLGCLGFEKNGLLDHGRIQLDGGIDIAHVWLDICGHVIDNTYVEDIPLNIYTKLKKSAKYIPLTNPRELLSCFRGDKETRAKGIPDPDYEAFEWSLKMSNEEKVMALSVNKLQLLAYQAKMMKFMYETFDIELPEIRKEEVCWHCDQLSESLKSCSKCKVARYCSKDCQKTDWVKIHKKVCLPPNSY